MERKTFGFSLPKFFAKKSTSEINSGIAASPSTSTANPFPHKSSQHSTVFEPNSETGDDPAFHGPQIGTRLPSFFNSTSTDRQSSRFFSPVSKTTEEYPFTPSRKSVNSTIDETTSPVTPSASPLPRVPSHPVSYESNGEVEELVIHRPHISTGLPSFFHRPFSSSASEFPFTPKRKQLVAEISTETPSGSSPIGYVGSHVLPFSTPSRFHGNRFLQTNRRSEYQLPTETQDQRFEDDSEAAEGANESEHSAFYRSQLNETVDGEKQHLNEGETNIDSNWTNGSSQSDQETIAFESQVHSITKQLLAAASKARSNIKAENTSLRREFSKSQQQILEFEAQFDELKKNESEAIKRANDLLFEKETLRNHLGNLQEQVSAFEEKLEQKQGQCEEVNSQLEDKEKRLKAALEHISTLEELLRSSEERLSALQTQLQLVLTEREAADAKVKALSEQVDSLQENLSSLELTMSNAESNFHSALNDYKEKQEKLAEELVNYQNTESALKKACTDFESVKEELGSCTNELIKAQTDSKAIAKEKIALEENFSRLNEKYSNCEKSLCVALENISSLESTRITLQAEIEQLKRHLETSFAELSATGVKVSVFQEKNEMLHSQLELLRNNLNDSEEKYQLNLTKMQQELDGERAGHTETKMSAVQELNDTKNALEFQVNELKENLLVIERQKESIKQELESERMVHSETMSHLKVCKNQLEEDRNQHLLESSKVQETVTILKDEKNALKSDITEFQGNLVAALSQNESIKKELEDEKTVHSETKSRLKSCEDTLEKEKRHFSAELCKIQSAMQKLSYQNKILEAQVCELKGNVDKAERQNETIKQELCCERTAHLETKSKWKLCKNHLEDDQNEQSVEISKLQSAVHIMNEQKKFMEAQVSDLQCKLVAAGRNHEAIREKHLSLERQLELSAIEISTLRTEAQEQSKRNNELQVALDDIQMKSALSEDSLKAALSKSLKELDSERETHQGTIRNLTEARSQLCSSESTCSETFLDQTKLQSDVTHLLNEKLKFEEIVRRLERTITDQEQNIKAVTEDNLKLMKDKMEIEETVKRMEKKLSFQEQNIAALISDNASLKQTLVAYEEYAKITYQKLQLIFNENFGAVTNTESLTTEIKTLNEKFETTQKNDGIVNEDLLDLNAFVERLIQTKTTSLMDIRERLEETQLCLASSNEALQRVTMEKSSLENEICGLRAEKLEFEKRIKTFTENSLTSESIQEKLRNRNAVLETMKSSASQQILDLQNRVLSADAELTSSNVKSQELAKEKASLENQLGSLRRQLQASHDKSENTVRVLIAEKEELEKKIEGYIETSANWKTVHEQICSRNSALNSSVASSNQQISDLQQRIHTLEKELDLSNEKVSDLVVDKTNLESQLGSLRHQLQVCQDKSNRDLEKLRNQLETERTSHEDYRLAITRNCPQESKELTLKECPKVVSKLTKRLVNDNKNSNIQRKEIISPSSPVISEELQRRPLSDSRQQLEVGKTTYKIPSNNTESSSIEFRHANRLKDNVNAVSNKIKEVDKRDGKKLSKNEENKPVEIIEESPPPAARKAQPRRAAVAAKQSLSVQISYEHSPSSSTSTNGSEQQVTQTSEDVTVIPGRKKLILTPSPPYPFPTPSPVSVDQKRVQKNAASPKGVVASRAHQESQQFNLNDSFKVTPLPPANKTYARKRLSMTARLSETNPSQLSTQQASKRSRRTFK